MMHLFIYLFVCGSIFFSWKGDVGVWWGTHAKLVVVWFWHTCVIHVQTLRLSRSIFMLLERLAVCMEVYYPLSRCLPIATADRDIQLRLLELCVCMCVCIEGCPLHKGLC